MAKRVPPSRNLSRRQSEGLIEVDNRKLENPSLKRLEAELVASKWLSRRFGDPRSCCHTT